MRQIRAVISVFSAGMFCLMLSHAVWAVTPEDANKHLFDAVWNNNLEAVQRSIGEGADPDAVNERGLSAIDVAVDKGFFEIAHYLLAAGTRITQSDDARPAPVAVPTAVPAAVPTGTPAPAPSVSVQPAPLENQAAALKTSNKQKPSTAFVSTPPVSVPPIEKELVDEAPEPILVLPVVPRVTAVQKESKSESPQETDNAAKARELQPENSDSDTSGFVEQLTNLFSPSQPIEGTAIKPQSQTVPQITPAPTPVVKSAPLSDLGKADTATPPAPVSNATDPAPAKTSSDTLIDKIGDLFTPDKNIPAPEAPRQVNETALDELELLDPASVDKPADTPRASIPDTSTPETNETAAVEILEKGEPPEPAMQATKKEVQNDAQPQPMTSIAPPEINETPLTSSFFKSISDFFSAEKPESPTETAASAGDLEAFGPSSESSREKSEEPTASSVTNEPTVSPKKEPAPGQKQTTSAVSGKPDAVLSPKPEPGLKPRRASELNADPAPGNSVNPFTRLTDLILDILPDVETEPDKADLELKEITEKLAAPVGAQEPVQEAPRPEKVKFRVEDLTVREDPYKVALSPAIPVEPKPGPTDIKPAEAAVTAPKIDDKPKAPPAGPTKQMALVEDDLSFGDDGKMGVKMPESRLIKKNCVIKKSWNSHFCVQPFKWPPGVRDAFGASYTYQGGGQSIVHYLAGQSIQYHGLFPTKSFNQIASYLTSRYGAPTEKPVIWTAMLAEARRRNPTFRWIAKGNSGGGDVVLEIREMDDLRWSAPPDKYNGVIRLYQKGANSIFRLLTAADLLLLQVRKGNDPATPPKPALN